MFSQLNTSAVPRVTTLEQEQFLSEFHAPKLPVISSSVMQSWPAVEKWSVRFLREQFGELVVPVYSSKPATGKSHQHAAEQQLALKDYLSMLEQGENDLRIFFYNILENAPELLKDFTYPDLGMTFFKRLPVLFAGGQGTKVQMHFDIDLANLLLCHFGGPKTVLLFPPDQTQHLYHVPYSFSALHDVDFSAPDFNKYPALKNAHGFLAHLEHGDCLYIPSGYWHFVVYDEIGFSMTLRSMPTDLGSRLKLLRNIFVTRTVEGVMRKVVGQRWNDRNERLAVERVHRALA